MDKSIIRQLLNDDETRAQIAKEFRSTLLQDGRDLEDYDLSVDQTNFSMTAALNKLNDTLSVGDMITVQVGKHVWLRGKYLETHPIDGRVQVRISDSNSYWNGIYCGRQVDLVLKEKAVE